MSTKEQENKERMKFDSNAANSFSPEQETSIWYN